MMSSNNRLVSTDIFRVFILFLILLSMTGCSLNSVAARQEKASTYWPELLSGQTYGQSFLSTENGLYRIDLSTATFARDNSTQVIFHLRSETNINTDIRSITLPGNSIQNERPTSFIFEPVQDSKDNKYYFFIESPDAVTGNAITVYINEEDRYQSGSAYMDGQPVRGDLVFTAYSQQTYTFEVVFSDFASRWLSDIPFLLIYTTILLCLGIITWRTLRKGRLPSSPID